MSCFDKYCDNNTRDVVQKRLLNNKCTDKIYHYTSMKVFDILLDSAIFRASNIFYLNDSEEYKAGYKEINSLLGGIDPVAKTNIEEIVKTMSSEDGKNICGLFTISFSKGKDSLHQWITYAKESGVAFEFDYNIANLRYKYEQNDGDYCTCFPGIIDLLYSEEDKKKFISNEFIESIINDKAGDWREEDRPVLYNMLVRMVASYIKNDNFEDEKEARITITPHLAGIKDAQTKIQYFPMDSGILRPYINIKICDEEDKPCLPLKSITVGPSGIQQTLFDSVVHRIKYGESKVYNYLNDNTGFVKNFICYLFEGYCIINNIKDDLVFGFTGWKYKNNKGLKNNISDAIDKLTFSEKDKSTLPKDFESDCRAWIKNNVLAKAVTHDWIQENEFYLYKFKYKITVKDRTDEAKKDRTKNNDIIVRLKTINQNLFFSKEGILIRKSKIPYIF